MTLLQQSQTVLRTNKKPIVIQGGPFPFMELPLELRWIVYNYHIVDYCTLIPTQIHETILPKRCRPLPPPLSFVCKSIQEEMLDQYRHLKVVPIIRISWQDKQFDELTKLHLQSLQIPPMLDFDKLRIQIYAPHPDRPCDILKVMRNTLRLCHELKRYHVRHLTITFLDTEIADWTREPDPLRVNYQEPRPSRLTHKGCSFMHVLNLFTGKVEVHHLKVVLPPSLVGERELERLARGQAYKIDAGVIGTVLRQQEASLNRRTGKSSWKRFHALTKHERRQMVFAHELEEFQAVWPHMDAWPGRVPR
ncbi:hypothetical protein MMC34_002116 [Xylographa carneopallida]|nr:hypothetical protein [Xylographa carneopallida]